MTRYRPEVDGLRALAVVLVILFHGGFAAFAGGFVGVDVFFVISGYLIASIIVEEMRGGRFSFGQFFERRARRIIPALYAVIVVTIPLARLTDWLIARDKRRQAAVIPRLRPSAFGSGYRMPIVGMMAS